MRKLAILIILVATSAVALSQEPPKTVRTQSDAQKAFEKLKTLAGSWQGIIGDLSMQVTIRVTSAGSAIMLDAVRTGGPGNYNSITMMYLEGDRLLMTHYSEARNRPRFEGKLSTDGKSVEFNLLDVAGGTQRGFMKRMMITIIDANHHRVDVTFMPPDGKPIEARGEFQRTK
jgi:hypothetical protein